MKTFVILLALVGLTLGATLHDIQKKLHEEKLKKRDDDDEVDVSISLISNHAIILYCIQMYIHYIALKC